MGKKPRRKFTRDFKLDAVKLVVEQGRGVREVADGLGISDSLLHRWQAQFLKEGEVAFPGHGKLNPHDDELRRLRKELKEVKMERELLVTPGGDVPVDDVGVVERSRICH